VRDSAGRIVLIGVSVLIGLILLELGVRLTQGSGALTHWSNIVLDERVKRAGNSRGNIVYDSNLGFAPRPGFASADLNNDERGFRVSPAATTASGPPILVVGDSFAQGDEVMDSETWPARLQVLTGRQVVNGAVSGYGIDQAVLRAGKVVPEIKPATLILSFIADDVRRSQMKRTWGAEKPYFVLEGGRLALRNVPVPPSPRPTDTLSIWQRLFGRSMLVDFVLRRLGWQYEWALDHERALSSHEGDELLCPLMRRLAELKLPTLVVAEYDAYVWRDAGYAPVIRSVTEKVLACAASAGLATLDMYGPMEAAVKRQGVEALYRVAHPGPNGTRLTAERIAAELEKHRLLSP
jgi:hypothetical protein